MKMLRRLKPVRRTMGRLPFLSLQALEGRDVPATLYVDPSFSAAGQNTIDADPVEPGAQVAAFGTAAFSKINDAVAIAVAGDKIVINAASYATEAVSTGVQGLDLVFQTGFIVGDPTVGSLDVPLGTVAVNGIALTSGGNNASTTIGASITGSGSLIKVGTGTLTLTANNAYTGITTVSAGTLATLAPNGLGDLLAGTTVAAGATLFLDGTFSDVMIEEPLTLSGQGAGNGGALRSFGNNTSKGGIVLEGTGARINSDSGKFTVSTGTITGTAKALALGGAGDTLVNSLISTGIGGTILKDGAGLVTLGNALNNFTAVDANSVVITLNEGILSTNGENGGVGALSTTGPVPAITVPSYMLINGGTLRGTRGGVGATILATPKGLTIGSKNAFIEVTPVENLAAPTGILNIYAGIITGPGKLVRVGNPATILAITNVLNNYTGGTQVSGGILRSRTNINPFPTATALTVDGTAGVIFDLNGVSTRVGSLTGAGLINTTSAVLTVGDSKDTVFTGNFQGTIAGLTGTGAIIKEGTGSLTLTGTNNLSGANSINAGTLVVDNATGSALGTGGTTVGTAGTLASSSADNDGLLAGAVTVNGKLAPGGLTAAGKLATGNLSFSGTGSYRVNLLGAAAGNGGTDQTVVTGTVSLGFASLVVDATGFAPAIGNKFTIIDNDLTTDLVTGVFNKLSEGFTFLSTDGQTFKISYLGGDGNDVALERVAAAQVRTIDDSFNGVNGDAIADIDPTVVGNQPGTLGVDAFRSFADAIGGVAGLSTPAIAGQQFAVNSGVYPEAVDLNTPFLVTFRENASTINSLAGIAGAFVTLDGLAINLNTGGNNTSTTFAGNIAGTGSILKIGTGTFTLAGVNTFSGTSMVTAGILQAGVASSLSPASVLDVTASGKVQLNGISHTVPNLSGAATGIVENGGAVAAVLSVGGNGLATTFPGILQNGGVGTLGFTKTGAGALTLPDAMTFTGPFILGGGSYTVNQIVNGGQPSPFGASSSAPANLVIRGGATLNYAGASTSTDRNLTWGVTGGTINISNAATTVTIAGSITGATPGTFTKSGAGTLDFTAADAFQIPTTDTVYGAPQTGNVSVTAGTLRAVNFRVNGTSSATITNRGLGARTLSLSAGATFDSKGTIFMTPGTSYIIQIAGPGTLKISNATGSALTPIIGFDHVGPVGGNGTPFGSIITAPIDLGTAQNITHQIIGKTNRNDVGRYSGDLRFNGNFIGSTPLALVGINTNATHNVHYVFNADNTTYTGAVSLANADLALTSTTNKSLTAANSLTFASTNNPLTENRASLFLFGRNHTIGSLNDISDPATTSFIRNGSRVLANGGTNTLAPLGSATLGSGTDAAITIVQSTAGTFNGLFGDGPNDEGSAGPAAAVYRKLNIIKQGTDSLTFTNAGGANATTGTISVSAGTLVNNTNFSTATSIGVGTAGSIGGTGTFPALTIDGRLNPGGAGTAGTLTLASLTGTTSSTLRYDLLGTTPAERDLIVVTGDVNLGGTKLELNNLVNPLPTVGTKFFLIDNQGTNPITGTFSNLGANNTIVAGGSKFQIFYDGDFNGGASGNDAYAVAAPNINQPVVVGFTLNNALTQRSRVTTINVEFQGNVTPGDFANVGDIKLTRYVSTPQGVNGTVVETGAIGANGLISITQPGPLNVIVLTFSNADLSTISSGVEFGSLSDGRWELTIPSASFASGQPTLGPPPLHRLFGDIDGNATVDASDFSFFPPFGVAANHPFDYNANSDIDGSTDFGEFGNRFGLTL